MGRCCNNLSPDRDCCKPCPRDKALDTEQWSPALRTSRDYPCVSRLFPPWLEIKDGFAFLWGPALRRGAERGEQAFNRSCQGSSHGSPPLCAIGKTRPHKDSGLHWQARCQTRDAETIRLSNTGNWTYSK